MDKQAILEEYRVLRAEIAIRLSLLHQIIIFANVLWAVLLIGGLWAYTLSPSVLQTYLLLVPLVFTGLVFNYQDNQRTLEVTAKYIEVELRSKLKDGLDWEKYFAAQKKRYQFSSAYKIFALMVPFSLPIIILISQNLNVAQTWLSIVDLVLLVLILVNFRYKLYRVK
jgi:hypothetical protein